MYSAQLLRCLFLLMLCLLAAPSALAHDTTSDHINKKPSDAAALEGIETGKVVWDITLSNPARLLFVMKVIDETYTDLVRQEITPDMVFTFHGRVLRLLSSQPIELDIDAQAAREELLSLIQTLSEKPGVRMESCSVASRILDIDNSTIVPAVTPVGNTFVSLIGYQQKGYAFIPIN